MRVAECQPLLKCDGVVVLSVHLSEHCLAVFEPVLWGLVHNLGWRSISEFSRCHCRNFDHAIKLFKTDHSIQVSVCLHEHIQQKTVEIFVLQRFPVTARCHHPIFEMLFGVHAQMSIGVHLPM